MKKTISLESGIFTELTNDEIMNIDGGKVPKFVIDFAKETIKTIAIDIIYEGGKKGVEKVKEGISNHMESVREYQAQNPAPSPVAGPAPTPR